MEQVLALQSDDVATANSWAIFSTNITLLSGSMTSLTFLTLCCRVFLPYYRNYHTMFSVSVSSNSNYLSAALTMEGVIIQMDGTEITFPLVAIPGYWNSFCLQLDFQNKTSSLNLNNRSFTKKMNASRGMATPSSAFLVFGQLQSDLGHFDSETSFRGQITDFYLWTRALTPAETTSYLNCQLTELDGATVKWRTDNRSLILNGSATVANVTRAEICRPGGTFRALLSPPLSMPVAASICSLLRGNLTTEGDPGNHSRKLVGNPDEWDEDKPMLNFRDGLMSDAQRRHEKLKWKQASQMYRTQGSSYLTSADEETSPWEHFEAPNSGRRKIREANPRRLTLLEELSFSAVCEFQEPPVFRASGFCQDLKNTIDEHYVVVGRKGELPIFQGFKGGTITYARGRWIADSPYSPGIQVWFDKTRLHPSISPMGRKLWLILVTVADDVMHKNAVVPCETEKIFLNLSPCPENHFTCSNGQCLSLNIRCDRKVDCEDSSDEDFCLKVSVPEEYKSSVPPPPLEDQNITEIMLKITILKAEIDLDIMTITAVVQLTWKDPSLMFFNLQTDPLSNLVDEDSLFEMWIPTLEMGNSLKSRIAARNDSKVIVLKEDFGTSEDYQFSWEALGYEGARNSIQLKEEVLIDSKCTFNAFLFPFGQQLCTFPFLLVSSSPEAVLLSTNGDHGGVSWERVEEDLKYEVSSIEFRANEKEIYSCQELVFRYFPRIGLPLISLFLPSLFTVIIAYSSFYLSLTHLPLRMGTSLMALVAQSAIQVQVGSPITSRTGAKASDIWLFGAFFLIFLIVVSHMIIIKEMQDKGGKREHTAKVMPVSMINGKANNVRIYSATTDSQNVWERSQKAKTIFSVLIPVLIALYIVTFAILVSVFRA